MKKHTCLYFALLLLCLLGSKSWGQSVFVKAYDPLISDPVIVRDSPNLVMAGSLKHNSVRSDFAVVRVDTQGQVMQSVSYDYDFIDELTFIRKIHNGGYIFGGHSWPATPAGIQRNPDSAKIVLGRLDSALQLISMRSYTFGNLNRGGVLTGLVQTQDNGFAFSVLTQANLPLQQLYVVKLNAAGQVEQERVFAHEQNLSYPFPSNNLIVKANGDLILSRHTTSLNGDHYGELIAMRDSLLPANGYIKWRSNYEVSAIHALAYDPVEDSMAFFFQANNGSRFGLGKTNGRGDIAWGAEEPGSLIALSAPRRIKLKMYDGYIISMADNRVSFWTQAGVDPKGISNPYQGANSDVVSFEGKMYVTATILLNSNRHPILVKTAVNDQTGNCFAYFLQNARFLSLNPVKRPIAPNLAALTANASSNNILGTSQNIQMADTLLCVGSGSVWPGDANSDGGANNRDALYVGLAFNELGPARQNAEQDSAWRATKSVNWFRNTGLVNGADLKHSDCNGDGIVDRKDLRPVFLNYSQSHGKNSFDPCSSNVTHPPLYLKPAKDSVEAGDTLRVWVMAGDSGHRVDSLYGIAFNLGYDMTLLDSSLGVNFRPINSWLAPRDTLLWLERDFFADGKTEVALSKAESLPTDDKTNSTGQGAIAYFDIFTIDDLIYKRDFVYENLHLSIEDVFAISLSETQVCFNTHADTVVLYQKRENTSIKDWDISQQVEVYPNPTVNQIFVHSPQIAAQHIELRNTQLQLLQQWDVSGEFHELSLSGLSAGLYFIRGESEKGKWVKKIIVIE